MSEQEIKRTRYKHSNSSATVSAPRRLVQRVQRSRSIFRHQFALKWRALKRSCGWTSSLRTFIFVFVFLATPLGPIGKAQADTRCGWIGSQLSPMTRAVAVSLGMVEPYGAIFEQPQPGSPAARLKIHAGDAVTRIDGRPLKSPREFEQRILANAPGYCALQVTWHRYCRKRSFPSCSRISP
jgi:membrane-associated protease RseP (regulator of RpoE activity)